MAIEHLPVSNRIKLFLNDTNVTIFTVTFVDVLVIRLWWMFDFKVAVIWQSKFCLYMPLINTGEGGADV